MYMYTHIHTHTHTHTHIGTHIHVYVYPFVRSTSAEPRTSVIFAPNSTERNLLVITCRSWNAWP